MGRPRRTDQLAGTGDAAPTVALVDDAGVAAARAALPGPPHLAALSGLFGALADPTRLRIIAALGERELCVSDLAAAIRLTESAVSHHLRLLRRHELVAGRRSGRRVFYALDDQHVGRLYLAASDHVRHRVSLEAEV